MQQVAEIWREELDMALGAEIWLQCCLCDLPQVLYYSGLSLTSKANNDCLARAQRNIYNLLILVILVQHKPVLTLSQHIFFENTGRLHTIHLNINNGNNYVSTSIIVTMHLNISFSWVSRHISWNYAPFPKTLNTHAHSSSQTSNFHVKAKLTPHKSHQIQIHYKIAITHWWDQNSTVKTYYCNESSFLLPPCTMVQ